MRTPVPGLAPYFQDAHLTVYGGDCLAVLPALPAGSVQTVVTSPPYWGLRDYGTATWEGGEAGCDHRMGPLASPKSTLQGYTGPGVKLAVGGMPYRDVCGKCGARRVDAQLGLEPTPDAYIANLVAVFREVRRVLRDDGTVWLNLGDSFFSTTRGSGGTNPETSPMHASKGRDNYQAFDPVRVNKGGLPLKPKDLVGIPWRVAFALQADGWWLRADIIWAKPNPMPESVTDRPTKAHEYVFLLAKAERYHYDAGAVAERALLPDITHKSSRVSPEHRDAYFGNPPSNIGWAGTNKNGTRNLRSVWTVTTAPYPGAHFATFPPKLIEPCIKAGCPPDGTVLDPFAGTGTVGLVANRLGRNAVLVDLNPEYLRQCIQRNAQAPLWMTAPPSPGPEVEKGATSLDLGLT